MQSHQLQKTRIIVSGSLGWTKVKASMERRTLEEVLSVKTRQGGQHG